MSDNEVEQWIEKTETGPSSCNTEGEALNLFAYPAQSNMTGYRPPLSWSKRIRRQYPNSYILLDAASYLTSGSLDLSDYDEAPDFVALAFYKIFSYPDLGALVVRRRAFDILRCRKYFGGGTVDMVIDLDDTWHASKTTSLHDVLEDGTLPFHNIMALQHALKVHKRLFGTRKQISQHTSYLCGWLAATLASLHYANRQSVVQLYLEKGSTYGNPAKQGPIIAFNILDSEGESVGKSKVEALANACGIQLRSGGVCNPGGVASMLKLSSWEMRRNFTEGVRCGNDVDVLGGKPTGILRVSLGPMSTLADVQTFARFVQHFFVQAADQKSGLLPVMNFDSGGNLGFDDSNSSHHRNTLTQHPHDNSIVPIKGCGRFYPPKIPGLSSRETRKVFATWHGQWCLYNTSTRQIMVNDSLSRMHLQISIEPRLGVLRISKGKRYISRSPNGINSSETQNHWLRLDILNRFPTPDLADQTKLDVDLWYIPLDHDANQFLDGGDRWVLYEHDHIKAWLSRIAGVPCTLARRRGLIKADQDDLFRCVVPVCQQRCPDRAALTYHYGTHAIEFDEASQLRDDNTEDADALSDYHFKKELLNGHAPPVPKLHHRLISKSAPELQSITSEQYSASWKSRFVPHYMTRPVLTSYSQDMIMQGV